MKEIFSKIGVLLENNQVQALVIVILSILAAVLFDLILIRLLKKLVRRTKTEFDDKLLNLLQRPIFYTVLFIGFGLAINSLQFTSTVNFIVYAIIKTLVVLVWSIAVFKMSTLILEWLSRRQKRFRIVQKRTIPLFDNMIKLVIFAGASYFILLSWKVNISAWLASAGIVGIAIGFAARDTLANLFSGIFIMADAPYKIGDFIVLDSGERGRVTVIGIRSTRILTTDGVEITLPNALIANAKIINESGGPSIKHRIRISIGVAYGSDIDLVRRVLFNIAASNENVCEEPPPQVFFTEFGDSSLNFQLLGWIEKSAIRGQVIDQLNTSIYKEFNQKKIEIPFPQRDIHLFKH